MITFRNFRSRSQPYTTLTLRLRESNTREKRFKPEDRNKEKDLPSTYTEAKRRSHNTHLVQSAGKNLSYSTSVLCRPSRADKSIITAEAVWRRFTPHHHSSSLRSWTMETGMPPTDDAYSVVETTDSVTALYGSDSNHLSDSEDSMDTSTPHEEFFMPSISAFEGIGSWTENIPNRADYLLLQPQLLLPTNSREAKAVIRGINRTDGKITLLTIFALLAINIGCSNCAHVGRGRRRTTSSYPFQTRSNSSSSPAS